MSAQSLHTRRNKNASHIRDEGFGGFIGTSSAMQAVYNKIENIASSNAAVFVTGESGTGKAVCAQAIHKLSPRRGKDFITLNCAVTFDGMFEAQLFGRAKGAFPDIEEDEDGLIRQADGGTLFFDNVCEICSELQTKLLRFFENQEFRKVGSTKVEKADVRIVCATNKDLLEEVSQGRLREDLYYRLYVAPIHMPPLRERNEDVTDLALTFLLQYALEEEKCFQGFSEEAEYYIRHYNWPGNIRQLQNVIRTIVIMNDHETVTADMLPPEVKGKDQNLSSVMAWPSSNHALSFVAGAPSSDNEQFVKPLEEIERKAIEDAIARCNGNIPRAAALLQVAPSTIYRKKSIWEKGRARVRI